MKTNRLVITIALLITAIGLSGCLDKENKVAVPYIPIEPIRDPIGEVKPLPEEIVRAYKKYGIEPGQLNPILNDRGEVFLFEYNDKISAKFTEEVAVYPFEATGVKWIQDILIFQWEGSKCTSVIIGGREERRCSHN